MYSQFMMHGQKNSKLHVSAYNGHREVSTTIKKSLYIYASIPCLL